MTLTPKLIRNALRSFVRKAAPTPTPTHKRVTPPTAPNGFDPEAFFKGITWYQKWEVFDGILHPASTPYRRSVT